MGGKTSTTTQQVQIPQEILDRYNAVNTQAQQVSQTPFQIYGTEASDFVAPLNQQQQQGIQNVNTAAGAYRPYFDTASAAGTAGMASAQPQDLNLGQFYNPYQQQVIDATMRQMGQANEQAQSGALGTAASSGAFGGDRAGIAAANLSNQQGLAMGSTLAGLNAQNYNQALAAAQQQQGVQLGATQADLARLMQGGQFMTGLGQAAQQAGLQGAEAQINAGTLGQQTEQAGISALYNQFQQQNAYPFQVAQFLANIAMGTGALSGSTTTTTQPTSWFSDRRLKEDIRRIGHTDDGMPIYKYKYKGDDNHQTHIGFMADEVEKVKPDAVGVSGGYKTVDYDRATKADGGGVAGPYGAQFGSQNPYGAGYVPQAILPVGQLMVADSGALQNSQQNLAQMLEASANFGENLIDLREKFGRNGTAYMTNEQRRAMAAANEQPQPAVRTYRGGVVHRATGGATYLQGQKSGAENPVRGQGYLADTLSQQERQKPAQVQSPGSAPQGSSTIGDLANIASTASSIATLASLSDRRMKHDIRRIGKTDHGMPIYSFKYKGDDREQTHIGFMADEVEKHHPDAVMTGDDGYKRVDYGQSHKFYQGGAVRPGYATDGAVAAPPEMDEVRRRLLADDVPAAQTLGSLPDARVMPASETAGVVAPPVERPALTAADMMRLRLSTGDAMPPANLGARPVPAAAVAEQPRLEFPQENFVPAAGGVVAPVGNTAPAVVVPVRNTAPAIAAPVGSATPAGVAPVAADYQVGQPVGATTPQLGVVGAQPTQSGGWNSFGPNVRQRESGNDYNALYNFSNREGGPFAGKNVTEMTINEALAFADPSGPYGRYVASTRPDSQYGVATPLGAYQIVGTTMREIANEMGLTGEELLTPELQDRMAKHLYDTRGEAPWGASAGLAGVSGGSRVSTSTRGAGVAGGYGIGGDKPYEDRTRLGQMFYDRDGRVNKDALLSILGGVGAMASSPSLYLGSAILQGIGGAANTYAALETARGEKIAKNLENMRQVAMDTMQWNELNGTNYTPAQYAKMNGLSVAFPEAATAQDILSGAYTPTTGEDGLQKLSYQEFQNGSVDVGGRTVRMQDDPASLQRFIQDNGIFAPETPIGRQVEIARTRLAEINASGGMTTDINGQQFQIPSYTAVGDVQTQAEANRTATAAFREAGVQRIPQIGQELNDTDKQTLIFTQLEAGALTNEMSSAAAVLDALGMPTPEGGVANAAMAQEAIKLAASRTISSLNGLPGGAPAAELQQLAVIAADTNLQPEAVKMILTMQKAALLRERDRYALRNQWAAENPNSSMDQYAYEQWFEENKPYTDYYEAVKESMPLFAGERGSRQEPHPYGSPPEEIGIGHFFLLSDGTTARRTE